MTEDCKTQKYFKEKSLVTSREIFRIRTNMNETRNIIDKKIKEKVINYQK